MTAGGGRAPAWSRDGRTLFFRRGREVLAVAASVEGDGIRFGEERVVLEWDVARSFEVGPDGTFYGVEPVPGAAVQTPRAADGLVRRGRAPGRAQRETLESRAPSQTETEGIAR